LKAQPQLKYLFPIFINAIQLAIQCISAHCFHAFV
jgi:hypothetical protein